MRLEWYCRLCLTVVGKAALLTATGTLFASDPPGFGADGKRLARTEWDACVVEGVVSGRRLPLALDTGAVVTAFDTQLLAELGVAPQRKQAAIAPSGGFDLTIYEPVIVTIDVFPNIKVWPAGLSMRTLSPTGHVPFLGIAGLDLLKQRIIHVSPDGIFVLASVPAEFMTSGSVTLDVAPHSIPCLPVVAAAGNEMHFDLDIDTGMTSALRLDERIISRLTTRGQLTKGGTVRVRDARTEQVRQEFVLRELTVANVRLRNIPVSAGTSNSMGLRALRHLNLILDFPRKQILIGKPPRDIVESFPMNASGMHVAFDADTNLNVLAVRADSAAAEAGVAEGDIVVSLDGKLPVDLSIYDVHEILARNGRTIAVTFRRGDELHSVDLQLKLAFEYPPNWAALDAEQEGFEKFLRDADTDAATKANP